MTSKLDIRGIKARFPKGTKIELISMVDEDFAPPSGTKGLVTHVDDLGTVFVEWEDGSGLGLIPDKDEFRIISD